MTGMLAQLKNLAQILNESPTKWALIGALAVSAHTEPRTTRDIDVAVVLNDKFNQDALIKLLLARNFTGETVLMHALPTHPLGIRLMAPSQFGTPVAVDLLFSSSGIESEIIADARSIEVFPGIALPVASVGHLIAMKVLAQNDDERLKDRVDLHHLLVIATKDDLEVARTALVLIERRGFNRGKDLMAEFKLLK